MRTGRGGERTRAAQPYSILPSHGMRIIDLILYITAKQQKENGGMMHNWYSVTGMGSS